MPVLSCPSASEVLLIVHDLSFDKLKLYQIEGYISFTTNSGHCLLISFFIGTPCVDMPKFTGGDGAQRNPRQCGALFGIFLIISRTRNGETRGHIVRLSEPKILIEIGSARQWGIPTLITLDRRVYPETAFRELLI